MPPDRDIDEQIRKHLAVLAYIIENSNQRNLQDINIYSEGTAAGLLNLLWDSKLIDLNREVVGNFPAIDLLDQDKNLFIQVTSDDTLSKIRKTHEKALEVSKSRKIDISPKILLLRFNKPNRKSTFTIIKAEENKGVDVTFENKDVICLNDLAHEIQNAETAKKSLILDYIKSRIPMEPESETFSLEVFMLRKFFESLSKSSEETGDTQPVSESEIEKKKAIYRDFWVQIQVRYRSVLDQQRERSFKAAFDRIGQADRLRMTQYLAIESMTIIDTLESPDPNEVIALLKEKIIQKIKLPLVSEMDIIHFLYYEFHHCNVLPIYDEVLA
jgi:Ni,Fe-hydrogenase maturation factor